jgi:chemotaxis protein MotA
MNSSTVLGILTGLLLLGGTIWLTTDDVGLFLNLPSLIIVLVGTMAATLISYPMQEVLRVFGLLGIVFKSDRQSFAKTVDEVVTIARLLHKQEDLPKIEEALGTVGNPFLRMGLQLVIDGTHSDDIINLMEWRIGRMQAKEHAEASIFHSMSHFAPAFGMFGTLVGLVSMLGSLGSSDFAVLGKYMSLAVMTTLYGVLLANLVFKPVAVKLERRTESRVMLMNMTLEGVLLIRERRTPSFIRQTLASFAANYEDELRERPGGRGRVVVPEQA